MDKSHFKEVFELDIPHWRDALQKCLNRFSD
jgi:dTDP-4-dehydrorhamnose reductase